MADYLPLFKPGQAVTFTADAAITGGQLVEVGAADRSVAVAGATSTKFVGVAGHDVKAGGSLTVHIGGVQLVKAAGAVARGAKVETGASGTVKTATTAPIGTALNAAADGALVQVLMS